MSEHLNNLLKKAYHKYQNDPNPPVPLETIKKYLELEGIPMDENNEGG